MTPTIRTVGLRWPVPPGSLQLGLAAPPQTGAAPAKTSRPSVGNIDPLETGCDWLRSPWHSPFLRCPARAGLQKPTHPKSQDEFAELICPGQKYRPWVHLRSACSPRVQSLGSSPSLSQERSPPGGFC